MSAPVFAITDPGVFPEMPEEVYHRDPVPNGSLSSTGARLLLEAGGPARFDYQRRHPRPTTKAFDLGHITHRVVLGKGSDIVRVDAGAWTTKKAKQARADAYSAGATPVLEADYQRVLAMVAALKRHPVAGALLFAEGDTEQSLFWVDKDSGMWCRARHDKATLDRNGRLIIVDLKSTEKASETGIQKSTANYGYHQQEALYTEGAIALGLDDDPGFVFVYVEKEPPHLVHVVQIDALALEVGRRRNAAALRIFAECTRTGTWPGYSDDITEISLPRYYPTEEY